MPTADYDRATIPAARVLDYGRFVWLEAEGATLTRLQVSGLPYQVYPDPFTLRLGEQSFDPLDQAPELAPEWDRVGSDGPDLHLIQFYGPTRAEWLDSLRSDGLEIVQYIHPFAYIVWGQPDALGRAMAASFVRWAGPFAPAYRLLPRWHSLSDEPVQVSVLFYRGADTDAVMRRIEMLGGRATGRAALNHIFEIAGFTISGGQLQAVAQMPGVYSVQLDPTDGGLRGEMSDQINVNNHNASNQAFPGYQAWLASVDLDGSGVIIANVDSGVDDNHADLVNRFLPCSGTTCGGSASSTHGTHTAGIMAADGSSGVTDSYGFLRGLGMAPGANLVEQVYNPFYAYPDGMLVLMTDSYNNGADLSGNSWGPSGTPQGYDDDTMQVDIGVRDADPDTPGNQPLNYILSFMNGYGGYQTQGTPDEAKNILTIGSTKMQTSGGAQILQIDDLSTNTAHGPALDGRTIPHMVAPGCYVDSTVPGSHSTLCGTSMASPHVSGAVALFIEFYRNLFGVDPSPALVKAAFLPVAHDLAGHLDADNGTLGHPFDSKQGWGRMDAEAVLDPPLPALYFDNPTILDNTGETWVQTVSVADPSQPAHLMLVWTDAYGHGLGGTTPAWNNDLDLVVEAGGDTYLGNNFGTSGWSEPGGEADAKNNTEGVFLGPTASGSITISVVASNINSDGVPNQGDDTDQDFALTCYNCTTCTTARQAAFTSDSPVELGEEMHFASTVTGTGPLTYTWNFGDGMGASHEADPSYTYAAHGSFTVTLTAQDLCGTSAVSDTVEVLCFAPSGEVSSSSPVTLGQPLHLTATVTGTEPLTYTWDLGDGVSTGTGANLVYTYTVSGNFVVSLTVDGPCGSQTITGSVTVNATERHIYLPLIWKRPPGL